MTIKQTKRVKMQNNRSKVIQIGHAITNIRQFWPLRYGKGQDYESIVQHPQKLCTF